MKRKQIFAVLLCLTTFVFADSSLTSVFGFIEKMAGSRDFFMEIYMKFDVDDISVKPAVRKTAILGFDLTVENLDVFQIKLLKPNIFEGITVRYDRIRGIVKYSYEKNEVISKASSELVSTTDIITSILDFLSTPIFDVNTTKAYTEFVPKNATVLSRFGVVPIRVRLYVEKDLPKKIVLMNDKTDETVSLEFKKFIINGRSN